MSIITELQSILSAAGDTAKLHFATQHAWLPPLVLSLFTIINSARIVAYVPQIVRAARDTNGASAISYTTWGLFLISHAATVLYALICIGDAFLALIFFGNAVACLAIVLVTFVKRRQCANLECNTASDETPRSTTR